jgi:peptide deformylase
LGVELEIVDAGHPVLRVPTVPVPVPVPPGLDLDLDELVRDMIDTLRAAPGVGLAANQVGRTERLALVEDRPDYHDGVSAELLAAQERSVVELQVLLNPVVSPVGDEVVEWFEGCLSVPGYTAIVPRWRRVHVTAVDLAGRPLEFEASGWHARILQHECDHLDGLIYVDRMLTRTFMTGEHYFRAWRGLPIDETKRRLGA